MSNCITHHTIMIKSDDIKQLNETYRLTENHSGITKSTTWSN